MKTFPHSMQWLLLWSLLFFSTTTMANMARPARAGQLNAEPTGLEKIAITRENLTIDLRPLPTTHHALVEAIYQINNAAAAQTIELVFVAATENMQAFQVFFDDQIISSRALEAENLPTTWQAPKATPRLSGVGEIEFAAYPRTLTKLVSFTITIPSGAHKIKAAYKSALSFNVLGTPTKYWQFAYVLAPARNWAAFGGLDVTVFLPSGYQHASSLPLQAQGETLRGSFAQIPADALTMTLQYQPSLIYTFANYLFLFLFGASLFGGLFLLCWRAWKRNSAAGKIWPAATLHACAWAIAIALTGTMAMLGADYFIPAQELAPYSYGYFFAGIFLCLLVIAAAIIGGILFGFIAKRSAAQTS